MLTNKKVQETSALKSDIESELVRSDEIRLRGTEQHQQVQRSEAQEATSGGLDRSK